MLSLHRDEMREKKQVVKHRSETTNPNHPYEIATAKKAQKARTTSRKGVVRAQKRMG